MAPPERPEWDFEALALAEVVEAAAADVEDAAAVEEMREDVAVGVASLPPVELVKGSGVSSLGHGWPGSSMKDEFSAS